MAYVPPHKRRSKDSERVTPTPEILVPQFKKNLNLRTSKFNSERSGKIIYAKDAIARWFSVGFEDDECNQSAVNLEAVSVESIERKIGGKPLVLVKPHSDKERNERRRKPWMSIAENVLPDFIFALKIVKAHRESPDLDEVKPTLVARFGKILFHGGSLVSAGSFRKSHITEALQRDLKRSFYTSVPAKYVENIVSKVIPKVKVGFEGEKDVYHVKLSDSILPDATLSCKCHVNEDNKLELYKVELNQVRNVVVDISCLEMDLDLRLMLCTKRILTHLSDGETQRIRALVSSAVVDPEVKGGLRWPLGMATSGDRYRVTGVWHTIATAYQNPSVRIKVRNADRYDFRTGTGEDAKEVVIKLKGILSEFETSVAFTSLVIAAVPTLHAMGKAAIALSKLADTAREELPSTMAAIRLSGMEISDLTLELSDLSQEITDGIQKSAQAVHAAEAGIRQIGSLARDQTVSMIQERANLPTISLRPVVVGAAKKTSLAVGRATKSFFNMISRGEFRLRSEDDSAIDRIEI